MKVITIEVCQGTNCHLLGSHDLLDALDALPESSRSRLDVRIVDCLKNCRKGPSVRIDETILPAANPKKLIALIEERLLLEATS